jgi:hypothetical protein
MPALDDTYKRLARWHLVGTGGGVPAGDLARIEEAINEIPDDQALLKVKQAINWCESAWADLQFFQNTITMNAESYAGDINRIVTRAQKGKQVAEFYEEVYYKRVDMLARILWVPEYRTPNSDVHRYARHGGEYVKSLPGTQGASGNVNFGFSYA